MKRRPTRPVCALYLVGRIAVMIFAGTSVITAETWVDFDNNKKEEKRKEEKIK